MRIKGERNSRVRSVREEEKCWARMRRQGKESMAGWRKDPMDGPGWSGSNRSKGKGKNCVTVPNADTNSWMYTSCTCYGSEIDNQETFSVQQSQSSSD